MKVWEIPVAVIGSNKIDESSEKVKDDVGDIGQTNWKLYDSSPINKYDEETRLSQSWTLRDISSFQKVPQREKHSTQQIVIEAMHKYLLTHVLPTDYPNSVDKGYAEFSSYCFLANTCGSAAMVLSTQTLLIAVGVGSTVASPMAGALNWVMKDGIGQLGGVLFASRITSNKRENNIDKDPKRWRMVSALSMDFATLLEILSPLCQGYFLLVASVANIGKNIGFLTASASRAALHQSLALKGNLGDVTAKAGSQSIAASLLGTSLGIGLTPLIGDDHLYITFGFICLSSIHQYCTYKSLKAVALKKFNRHRLMIALELYICNFIESKLDYHTKETKDSNEYFLSPTHVAKFEKFVPFVHSDDSYKWLRIGSPLIKISPTPNILDRLINECLYTEKYVLNCEVDCLGHDLKVNEVLLTFHHDATDIDVIRGMFHAQTINILSYNNNGKLYFDLDDDTMIRDNLANNGDVSFHVVSKSYQFMIKHQDDFLRRIKRRWDIKGDSINVESASSFRIKICETKS